MTADRRQDGKISPEPYISWQLSEPLLRPCMNHGPNVAAFFAAIRSNLRARAELGSLNTAVSRTA